MLEILFEAFAELLIEVFGELLVAVGLHVLSAPFQDEANPWVAAAGYTVFGAVAGGLSLLVLPHHLAPPGWMRYANLVFTPLAAGGCMAAIGAWRARHGRRVVPIERFLFGFVFAAGMAAVRTVFAD